MYRCGASGLGSARAVFLSCAMSPEESKSTSLGDFVPRSKVMGSDNSVRLLFAADSGDSLASFAHVRSQLDRRAMVLAEGEDGTLRATGTVSSFGQDAGDSDTPVCSRVAQAEDRGQSIPSDRATPGRSRCSGDRPPSPPSTDPRSDPRAKDDKPSSRLSFGIDAILGSSSRHGDHTDHSRDDNDDYGDGDDRDNIDVSKSCSDVDSDHDHDDDDDDDDSAGHKHTLGESAERMRSPVPPLVGSDRGFRDAPHHLFLPRFGLEHLHPAALLPHPGVIRVPTHRPPQPPVFPLWPPAGYGLPWMDMRRDRFGCEYVMIVNQYLCSAGWEPELVTAMVLSDLPHRLSWLVSC